MRRLAPLPPTPAARLAVLALFAGLGALHWARMIEEPALGRALGPVAVAVAGAAALLLAERLPGRWGGPAVLAIVPLTLAGALLAAGVEWRLLRPGGWDVLGPGLASGLEAVSGVRLPYSGADPWPRLVLQAGSALLVALAALLAVWPRLEPAARPVAGGARAEARARAQVRRAAATDPQGPRGYPVLATAGLVALVAVPAVSLGNDRPFVVGTVLAALVVLFLCLDRIVAGPRAGVAALLALALLGALPVARAADRDGPWFDYESFAESVGPADPVRIDFGHSYGPIELPRDGREVLRVRSEDPLYWKAEILDRFDGERWTVGGSASEDPEDELTGRWRNQPRWTESVQVSVRRLRTRALVAPGTTMEVRDATRRASPGPNPGVWRADRELRRGDSYAVRVHVPRPTAPELEAASADPHFRRSRELTVEVPVGAVTATPAQRRAARLLPRSPDGRAPNRARVRFAPWESAFGLPEADFPETGDIRIDGDIALNSSPYRRTWRLARRLRAESTTPYDYVRRVDAYLERGFRYDERPAEPPPGRAVLDAFLFDTRSGYCQHYSAAMALLLRMGGVPARVVTGFSPGGYSKRRGEWIVRDTDAHSWVEAWFEAYGWVTFDPTPSSTPARSQVAAIEDAAAAPGDDGGDSGDDAADAGDPAAGGAGARGPGGRGDLLLDASGRAGGEAPADADGDGSGGVPWPLWTALALVVAAAAAALVRRRRGRGHGGDAGAADHPLRELERALQRTGRDIPGGTTLAALERRLGGTPEAAGYFRALRTARYTPAPAGPTRAQRRAVRRELAAGLGPAGRLRALWALPPRRS